VDLCIHSPILLHGVMLSLALTRYFSSIHVKRELPPLLVILQQIQQAMEAARHPRDHGIFQWFGYVSRGFRQLFRHLEVSGPNNSNFMTTFVPPFVCPRHGSTNYAMITVFSLINTLFIGLTGHIITRFVVMVF
jgi:hypothetical protein